MVAKDITVREIITGRKVIFEKIGCIFDDNNNFANYNVHSNEFDVKDITKVFAVDKILNLS